MFYWVCSHLPFCSHNQNRLYYCFLPHCLHGTVHLLKGIKPNQIFHWKFSLSIPPDHLRNRLLRDRKAFICTFPSKSVYEPAAYSAGGSIRFQDFWQNSKTSVAPNFLANSKRSDILSTAMIRLQPACFAAAIAPNPTAPSPKIIIEEPFSGFR